MQSTNTMLSITVKKGLMYNTLREYQVTKPILGWVWWCLPIIPTLWRFRQKDPHKFKASMGYIVKRHLKKKKKKKKVTTLEKLFVTVYKRTYL